MNLQDYYHIYPDILKSVAYLERRFVEKIFLPEYGENGLDYLQYQKQITHKTKRNNYYIDFVVETDGKKFAIEIDGYEYHGKLSKLEFESAMERTNEITRQGYTLVHYTYDMIQDKPYEVKQDLRDRFSELSEKHNSIAFNRKLLNWPSSIEPINKENKTNHGQNKADANESVVAAQPTQQVYTRSASTNTKQVQKNIKQQSMQKESPNLWEEIIKWIVIVLIIYGIIKSLLDNSMSKKSTNSNSTLISQPVFTLPSTSNIQKTPTSVNPSFMVHRLSINVEQTVTNKYSENKNNDEFLFFVEDPKIIQVTLNSDKHILEITGITPGETDILLKNDKGNVIDTCHVTVKPNQTPTPKKEWSFEKNKLTLKIGESSQLKFFRPTGAYFTYEQSKIGIANISYENSKNHLTITGISTGTCKINLISDKGIIEDTCVITVIPK